MCGRRFCKLSAHFFSAGNFFVREGKCVSKMKYLFCGVCSINIFRATNYLLANLCVSSLLFLMVVNLRIYERTHGPIWTYTETNCMAWSVIRSTYIFFFLRKKIFIYGASIQETINMHMCPHSTCHYCLGLKMSHIFFNHY